MERRSAPLTFTDHLTHDLGGPRSRAFFDDCERLIPWQQLAGQLGDLFSDTPKGGRPHWPIVLMLKGLLLQRWFQLSDPQLEEVLRDRLSFRRFVGLSLDDATPDETTFCVFRERLRHAGQASALFEAVNEHLRQKGVILQNGTLVDALIVSAPNGRSRADGSRTRDGCASGTRKHGRHYVGYKAHIASDRRGLITNYVFDTASPHDSVHFDQLTANEKEAAYGDAAYMSQDRREALEARGVFCGILYRRVRHQKELSQAQRDHNRRCAKVRGLVELPFAWLRNWGYHRVRYRGLLRNAVDFVLHAIAYNLKRSLKLLAAAT